MFIENKYAKWYFAFAEFAKNRVPPKTYLESHHVIPAALGGSDEQSNKILVTAREHFILHAMLTRCTEGDAKRKMCYALSYFRTANKNHSRKLTSRQYEMARAALSFARKGVQPSETCKAAVSKARKGVPVSAEAKKKIGLKLQVRIPFFFYRDGEYRKEEDFYRYCDEHQIGRANVQAKIKKDGIAVVTAGKHKGSAFAFSDVGASAMSVAVERVCGAAKSNRTSAVKVQHTKRKKEQTPIVLEKVQVNEQILVVPDRLDPTTVFEQRKTQKIFFLFDDEIRERSHIVQSMINHADQKDRKIHARKTTVRELSTREGRDFLNAHHLQGAGPGASLYIGLVYEDELVSVMSLGAARYNREAKFELLRFASRLNCTVVGGASKLIKHARLKLQGSIVSYADLRYGNGEVYRKCGFEFRGLTKPGYWYIKDGKRYHRTQFQKHKLPKLISTFDPNLTEIKNMENNGYRRVFDAGHAIFIYK